MQDIPFREGVGSLLYAALGKHPDIVFATSALGKFAQNPGMIHWEALKRVMRYLKGPSAMELVLGGKQRGGLEAYADADLASQEHRHSISGYAVFMGEGTVSWSSKKQGIVGLSTTEAEYIAATHAAKEIIWLHSFLAEIAHPLTLPTTLFCDNQGAIALTKDSQYHARTKHINMHFHFICEAIQNGVLTLTYCPTEDMVADVLTKPLPRIKLVKFRDVLGLRLA